MTGRELENGIERETNTAESLAVVTEVEDKGITEVVAETDRTVIAAGIVIATEIDIGTGANVRKNMENSRLRVKISI